MDHSLEKVTDMCHLGNQAGMVPVHTYRQKHSYNKISLVFKKVFFKGLARWLSGLEHLLFLQKTQVPSTHVVAPDCV